jgi:predicted Rossmann-fold nucleotide-binding protein
MTQNEEEVPGWVTKTDREILKVLTTGLVLSPSIIAYNIDRSRKGVSNRLDALRASGLVEKVDRRKYKLSDTSEKALDVYGAVEVLPADLFPDDHEQAHN